MLFLLLLHLQRATDKELHGCMLAEYWIGQAELRRADWIVEYIDLYMATMQCRPAHPLLPTTTNITNTTTTSLTMQCRRTP